MSSYCYSCYHHLESRFHPQNRQWRTQRKRIFSSSRSVEHPQVPPQMSTLVVDQREDTPSNLEEWRRRVEERRRPQRSGGWGDLISAH
uniref:Uncharacterized protein n=1 Tax=Arundo donax TaxID=35708 RepID=A0A0A9G1Q6_ARUDO